MPCDFVPSATMWSRSGRTRRFAAACGVADAASLLLKRPDSRRRKRKKSFSLDPLEPRLLFTGIPINSITWTSLGPQPVLVGNTPGSLSVSGRISAIAVDPNNSNSIYAATAGGGVWKSSDGGSTWAALTDSQATLFTGAIAFDPENSNTIYAGTGNPSISNLSFTGKGILKSTDGGNSWTLLGGSVFNRKTISQIVVDPTNSNTIYAAVAGGGINGTTGGTGIWKSTDGGNTWTNTTTAISTSDSYTDLVISPNNPQILYAAVGTFFGSIPNGVYQTTNGGASWSVAGTLPTGNANGWTRLAIAPTASGSVLYASIAGTGVIGSTPLGTLFKLAKLTVTTSGSTWTTLGSTPNYLGGTYTSGGTAGSGYFDSALAVSPTNANIVFAGGASGTNSLVYSTNGGTNWTDISSAAGGAGPHGGHHDLTIDPAGNLLDATDGGAFKYAVSNNTWTSLNSGLGITQINGVALNPSNPNIAYAATQDNGLDEFTGGVGWSSLRLGSANTVLVDYNTPATVYREEALSVGSTFIERSDNSGSSWSSESSGISTTDTSNTYPAMIMDPGNPQRLLVGTNRVYESTNKGASWTARSTTNTNGWTVSDPIDALAAAKSDINTIYATDDGFVFVTTNRGSTWTKTSPVSSPSSSLLLNDIVVDPSNAQIAYVVAANYSDTTGGPHVWRTTNGGATWTSISGNLPDMPVWSIALVGSGSSSQIFIGTDGGVYDSTNLGASWSIFGSSLPNAQVRDLAYANGTLAAATDGRGVWEISLVPQVSSAIFNDNQAQHTLTLTFTENVGASLSASDLTVTNLQTMATEPIAMSGSYNTTNNSATFIFTGHANGTLPDGYYQAVLNASGVVDSNGRSLPANYTVNFFHLAGDANHDGIVNASDFAILAANYNQTSGVNFSSGDFNYDGTVNALDFNVLATQFGTVLSAPTGDDLPDAQAATSASSSIATSSLFSDQSITPFDDDLAAVIG